MPIENDSGSVDWFQALSPGRPAPEPSEPARSVSPGPATNADSAAYAFELRVTPTVGAGREAMDMAGQNASSAAHTFEERVSQGGTQH